MGSTAAGATYHAYNQLIRSPSLHLSCTKSMQQCGVIEQTESGITKLSIEKYNIYLSNAASLEYFINSLV
ncbi:unnamed protein product [Brugia timori]|uniref:Uncharacterized protein n=1 Tax=Brugia timori TaxID=42155 RepID=A0A0R3QV21_9BILA|nr:unnamed protein product [Brugia timori]